MSEDDEKKIAVLEERVKNWMDTTTEYRITLCKKIDKLFDILSKLPCDRRSSIYDSMKKQMAFMWIVISGVVIVLLKEAFLK